MKELVVISGKGGTGKTSVTAALAQLSGNCVVTDCDVDAADLHLLLEPLSTKQSDFYSGFEAVIDPERCDGCGVCLRLCRFSAIEKTRHIDGRQICGVMPFACDGCGVCVRFCPENAIDFPDRLCGEWMLSETRFGTMVHAQLGVASENSGKLVTHVREQARKAAGEKGIELVLVDGPPGIGCPVIAAVTGATQVLVVTEPTVSGEHDLERILELARHFQVPAAVSVNKWDINPRMSERMEARAKAAGATVAARIRYDGGVTQAQLAGRTALETNAACADDLRELWYTLGL